MRVFHTIVCVAHSFTIVAAAVRSVTDCSCGYYDPTTQEFYTDSAIVYFNESTSIPGDVLEVESYQNQYEQGWNARYTQGADAANAYIGTDPQTDSSNTSLRLFIDPSNSQHHVVGGAVHTVRQDIYYGSFRALMRSPRSWHPGSALSMTAHYNNSQTINLDLLVPNDPGAAWVGLFLRNEFANRDRGVSYKALANRTNGILPWDYTEYRFDWFENKVDYYIAGKLFRTVLRSRDGSKNFPQTPAPIRLKHWADGDWFTTQGPPTNRSEANVGWFRSFFNSSLTTDADRAAFTRRCNLKQACSTEDMQLRGSSPYTRESVARWSQAPLHVRNRHIPTIIVIVCGSLSGFLILNALLRRVPELRREPKTLKEIKRLKQRKFDPSGYAPAVRLTAESATATSSPPMSRPVSYFNDTAIPTPMASETPVGSSDFVLGDYFTSKNNTGTSLNAWDTSQASKRPRISWRQFSDGLQGLQALQQPTLGTAAPRTRAGYDRMNAEARTKNIPYPSIFNTIDTRDDISVRSYDDVDEIVPVEERPYEHGRGYVHLSPATKVPTKPPPSYSAARRSHEPTNTKVYIADMDAPPMPEPFCLCEKTGERQGHDRVHGGTHSVHGRRRIEYLAGFLSFSCLLVTAIQFSLTFSPASVVPGAAVHYETETWVRKTVSSYLLNLVWVGKCPPSPLPHLSFTSPAPLCHLSLTSPSPLIRLR